MKRKFLRSAFGLLLFLAASSMAFAQPASWTYTITATNHTILVNPGTVTISGAPIAVGDYIGVFFDSLGTPVCGGASQWTGGVTAVSAWGADAGFDGFAANEAFQWKVWQAATGMIIDMTATYMAIMPNAGNFAVNGTSGIETMTGTAAALPLSGSGVETNVACHGICTGAIDVTPNGGTPPYAFAWSNGETTEDLAGLCGGTYDLTITDASGGGSLVLPWTSPITATNHTILVNPGTVTINGNAIEVGDYIGVFYDSLGNAACGGLSMWTGGVTAVSAWGEDTGDDGFATNEAFQWKVWKASDGSIVDMTATYMTVMPNQGNFSVNGTSGIQTMTGTYTPTTAASVNLSFTVVEPDTIMVTEMISDYGGFSVSVNGATDGSIDLTVVGGVAPYSYIWNNGTTTEDLSAIGAGTYEVTIMDANGCAYYETYYLTEPAASDPLAGIGTETMVSCNAACDGAIDITISGGVTPYTFAWSNGETTEDVTNLCAGTYDVTVTDGGGTTVGPMPWTSPITATNHTILFQPTSLVTINGTAIEIGDYIGVFYDSLGTPACGGFINWTGGTTSVSAWGEDLGNDGFAANEAFQWKVWKASDGSIIDMVATYMTGPFPNSGNFAVNGMSSVATLIGTYTPPTVSGPAEIVLNYTITEPAVVAISEMITDVACYGDATGAIDITVTGGTAPYTYTWSNNAAMEDVTGLTAGTYDVTVTDANGCVVNGSYIVIEATELMASTVSTDPACFMGLGSVDLTVSGGTAPYTYAWTGGATTEDLIDVAEGAYEVIVTDANGCTATASGDLIAPDAISISEVVTNVLCSSDLTGAVDLTVGGGTAPYTYAWDNGTNSEDLAAIGAGTYMVTVTDANLCEMTATYNITEPAMLVAVETLTNVSCNGGTDGAIDIAVTGGVTPYGYNWNNMYTTEDLAGLSEGTYELIITDANGCTFENFYTITEPTALALSFMLSDYAGYGVSVFGATDGTIDMTVAGGVAPYSFLWSNSDTYEDLSALAAGTYDVTVTDANGCEAFGTQELTSPPAVDPISATFVVIDVTCAGGADGAIDMTTAGGWLPLTFAWSNGETTEDVMMLMAGTYTVTITDDSNDSIVETVIVNDGALISVDLGADAVICDGQTYTLDAGTFAAFNWSTGESTQTIDAMAAGTYVVTVTDANGCTATDEMVVTVNPVYNTTEMATICEGDVYTLGSQSLTMAGTYTEVFQSVDGCDSTIVLTLNVNPEPAVLFNINGVEVWTGSTFEYCYNETVIATLGTIASGIAPFDVAWEVNGVAASATGVNLGDALFSDMLAAGTHAIQITSIVDANGCAVADVSVYNATVTINPEPAVLFNFNGVEVWEGMAFEYCEGEYVSATLGTIASGVAPFDIAWEVNGVAATATGVNMGDALFNDMLAVGTHAIQITSIVDANGCAVADVSVYNATITINPEPTVLFNINNVEVWTGSTFEYCYNETVTATLGTIVSGTAPFDIAWEVNGVAASVTGVNLGDALFSDMLAVGTHAIQVTSIVDANGCAVADASVYNATVTINAEPAVLFNFNGVEVWEGMAFEYCEGEYVSATLGTIASGVAPFDIAWEVNGVAATATGVNMGDALFNDMLAVGTHAVQITSIVDANGCAVADVSVYNATITINPVYNTTDVATICEGDTYTFGTQSLMTAGTYTEVFQTMEGCDSTVVLTLNVNPEPTVLFNINNVEVWTGSTFEYCYNETVTATLGTIVSGTAPFDIAWEVNGVAATATGVNLGDALFSDMLAAGTHAIQVTSIVDANGCAVADASVYNATVTINAEPAVLFNFNGVEVWEGMAFEYCEGEYVSATLGTIASGVAPFDIAWEVNGVAATATGVNMGDALFNDMLAVGTHAVQITSIVDANGCAVADVSVYNATITINPVYNTTDVATICEGDTYTFGTQSLMTAGTYTEVFQTMEGCDSTVVLTLNVNPEPTVLFNINNVEVWTGSTFEYCYNETVTATLGTIVSGTAPFDIAWEVNGVAATATGVNLGDALFSDMLAAGTHAIQVTSIVDANGCAVADASVYNATVTINAEPAVLFNFNGVEVWEGMAFEYCEGEYVSATLGTIASGVAPFDIAWEVNGVAATATGVNMGDALFNDMLAVGTHAVQITSIVDANGCAVADVSVYNATITINPEPAVLFEINTVEVWTGSTFEFCYDETVTATLGTIASGTAPFDIAWEVNGVAASATGVNLGDALFSDMLPAGTHAIQITSIVDANGCAVADASVYNATVTINAMPVVDLGADAAICEGDVHTLDAGLFDTYLWSNGETTQMIDVAVAGTYTVEVTDVNGCMGMDEFVLTVNPLPVVDLGADVYIYSGDVATLDAGMFTAYLWSTGETTQTIDVTDEGTYTVEVTDANGCTNSDAVMVYITPELTAVDLVESTDMSLWTPVMGDLATGYFKSIDPAVSYYYIDAASSTSTVLLAQGMYGFNVDTYPADWFTYWAGRGVDATVVGGWQAQMWQIINGNSPIFYLKVDAAGAITVVDGLQYDFASIEEPLRVNGDYLGGAYTYTGMVTSATGVDSDPITVAMEFSGTAAAIQAAIDGTNIIAPATVDVMNGLEVEFDATVDYPTFSGNLPQDLLVDAMIELGTPFTAGAVISVDYNGVPVGTYTALGTETSLWLSEALNLNRTPLYTQIDATWTINVAGLEPGTYNFNMTSISATAANFNDPANRYELATALTVIDVYTVAPDITAMTPADSSMLDGWVTLTVTTEDLDDEVAYLEVDVTKVGVQGSGQTGGQWLQFNIPTDPTEIAQINAAYVGIAELGYNAGVFTMYLNTQAVANPFLDFPGWGDGEYVFWYIAYDELGNQSGVWGDVNNPVDNIRYFIETQYDVQTINLVQGYSIISTFIDPAIPDVADVFGSLGLEVQLVKDEMGNPYWPAFGLNNVGDMDLGEGYQVKMNTAQVLMVEGTQVVPETTPVDMPAGWSLFGYLRTSAMDVAVAMSSIASDINVIKTGSGLVYWPAFAYNSIGDLNPGVGYKARMLNAATLYYPANVAASAKSGVVAPVNRVYTDVLNTGADMTVGIPANAWETTPAIGDEVAIYSPSGLLVGAGVYTGGNLAVTIWGNDTETAMVDGMEEGTAYSISLMRVTEGVEETFEVTEWSQGNGIYADNAIDVVAKLSSIEAAPSSQLFQNVPNPVSTSTEIRFFLANDSKVTVSIFDAAGKRLEVLVSETMTEGNHTVIFNVENYAAGNYMYTIETPEFKQSKQLTVVK